MKKSLSWFQLIVGSLAISQLFVELNSTSQAINTSQPSIIRLDQRFDAIVGEDTLVEKLADGFRWVEGPVWNRTGRFLLFSDVQSNRILKWEDGKMPTVLLQPSGYTGKQPFLGKEPGSNGLTYDDRERLVFCQHGDRKISRLERDGSLTTLADRYEGKRLNSPNDLVYKSNGDLYFTDPPFGLPGSFEDPDKELQFQGVYRLSADGRITLLTKEVRAPNGIAFSSDEKVMYVSDPLEPAWFAFDVTEEGLLANKRLFLDATPLRQNGPGGPDGIKVDERGNLFTAGPAGLYILASDGTLLGRFDFGVATGNCAWGEDGSALFVTANTAIYRINLKTRGARF